MLKRVKIPGVLFISELPPECKEDNLREILTDFGPISKIDVSSDELVSYARITYESVEDAFSAMQELVDDLEILGEPVR